MYIILYHKLDCTISLYSLARKKWAFKQILGSIVCGKLLKKDWDKIQSNANINDKINWCWSSERANKKLEMYYSAG